MKFAVVNGQVHDYGGAFHHASAETSLPRIGNNSYSRFRGGWLLHDVGLCFNEGAARSTRRRPFVGRFTASAAGWFPWNLPARYAFGGRCCNSLPEFRNAYVTLASRFEAGGARSERSQAVACRYALESGFPPACSYGRIMEPAAGYAARMPACGAMRGDTPSLSCCSLMQWKLLMTCSANAHSRDAAPRKPLELRPARFSGVTRLNDGRCRAAGMPTARPDFTGECVIRGDRWRGSWALPADLIDSLPEGA